MEKHIVLTFTEPLLGTVPKNKEIYTDFVASKAPHNDTDDEVDTVVETMEKAVTGFHRTKEGQPLIYDYVIKGFFKDACSMLRRVPDSRSKKLTAYKKTIDGLVFVFPRQIIIDTKGAEIDYIERPLRAQTAKGERIALSKSEAAQPGSMIQFDLKVLGGVSEALLKEWLDYGALRGLGQWRNAGYGSFKWEYA